MKATIDENGVITIKAQNKTEAFALSVWANNNNTIDNEQKNLVIDFSIKEKKEKNKNGKTTKKSKKIVD